MCAVLANVLAEYAYCAITQHSVITVEDQMIVGYIAITVCGKLPW